jgi:putative two-component system response regulator
MTQNELTSLSFANLRDRLKARADQPDNAEDIEIHQALRYLMALADNEHTTESVGALVQLARNFHYASKPTEALQAASHAARFAVALEQKLLLCAARGIEGLALSDLGRFAEATVMHAETLSLARELQERGREIWTIIRFGVLCGGMGQVEVAIRYFERARELAKEDGFLDCECYALSNLVACAVNLRDPASGLLALSKFRIDAPQTRQDMLFSATVLHNHARLCLLVGDVGTARIHAKESARFAGIAGEGTMTRATEALLGLIDVWSGAVERGLLAVDHALTLAKQVDHTEVPDHLGMCIDAYEAAGHLDKALVYLHELVAWKKKSIEAEILPLQYDGSTESIRFQTGISLFDDDLLARAHSLQAAVQDRTQRFVEMAINAGIVGGHDLYHTFRVAKLARYLGAAVGWDERRIAALALGAQLCNIGMMAVPARVLQKPGGLSDGERYVLRDHARYGAELLRKSRLRILDVAGVIAEQHQERYDGTGYPLGICGAAISEEARIVTICDAFDAMTHPRPWRVAPLSIESALNELKQGAGSQFDPLLVTAFVDLIEREFREHGDFDAFLAEGADELEYVRARARMEAFIAEGR